MKIIDEIFKDEGLLHTEQTFPDGIIDQDRQSLASALCRYFTYVILELEKTKDFDGAIKTLDKYIHDYDRKIMEEGK